MKQGKYDPTAQRGGWRRWLRTPSFSVVKLQSSEGAARQSLLVALITLIVTLLLVWPLVDRSIGGDHYVYLARSFASGSLAVDGLPGNYRDYVDWGGHKYLPFGPLPAVFLIPFIPLINAGVPLVLFGLAFSVINLLLVWRILGRIGVAHTMRAWLALLFFGGTGYFAVALTGISTYFAHIVATTFLLIAIAEATGKQRYLIIGLAVGLAAASRFTLAFSAPFFILMAYGGDFGQSESTPPADSGFLKRLMMFATGIAVPLGVLALYNFARFGDPSETGFGLALLYDPVLAAARAKGVFSIHHVPKNLFMMLLQGPRPVGGEGAAILAAPFVEPSRWGMSLFLASPALIYAFRAPLKDRLVRASWAAIGFTLFPILTYYGIGFVQFGYRYALDFMPFALLLVARGMPPFPSRVPQLLIATSVLVNIWGAIFVAIWI